MDIVLGRRSCLHENESLPCQFFLSQQICMMLSRGVAEIGKMSTVNQPRRYEICSFNRCHLQQFLQKVLPSNARVGCTERNKQNRANEHRPRVFPTLLLHISTVSAHASSMSGDSAATCAVKIPMKFSCQPSVTIIETEIDLTRKKLVLDCKWKQVFTFV